MMPDGAAASRISATVWPLPSRVSLSAPAAMSSLTAATCVQISQ
jgi:hypothetical protein